MSRPQRQDAPPGKAAIALSEAITEKTIGSIREGPILESPPEFVTIIAILSFQASGRLKVVVHKDSICHYSLVIKAALDRKGEGPDGNQEYNITKHWVDETVLKNFSQWLYNQTFDGFLTHADSLQCDLVPRDEDRWHMAKKDLDYKMRLFWEVGMELELPALQTTALLSSSLREYFSRGNLQNARSGDEVIEAMLKCCTLPENYWGTTLGSIDNDEPTLQSEYPDSSNSLFDHLRSPNIHPTTLTCNKVHPPSVTGTHLRTKSKMSQPPGGAVLEAAVAGASLAFASGGILGSGIWPVIVHKDYLCHHSPIAEGKLEKSKRLIDSCFEYEIQNDWISEQAVKLFAQWLYSQKFDNYISEEDSMISEDISSDKDQLLMVSGKQKLVAQLWLLARELQISELQDVAALQLKRSALKFGHLAFTILNYDDEEDRDLRGIWTDIWACLLMSTNSPTSEVMTAWFRGFEVTDSDEEIIDEIMGETWALVLKRCGRPDNIWGSHDDPQQHALPSTITVGRATDSETLENKPRMDLLPRDSNSTELVLSTTET
ncbi:hypothetical protein B0J14DRAFT_564799 [Halenospora varia]|nr:hypothetical protein B0J14DRAFT_564799 [Halenospora varia]